MCKKDHVYDGKVFYWLQNLFSLWDLVLIDILSLLFTLLSQGKKITSHDYYAKRCTRPIMAYNGSVLSKDPSRSISFGVFFFLYWEEEKKIYLSILRYVCVSLSIFIHTATQCFWPRVHINGGGKILERVISAPSRNYNLLLGFFFM